MVSIPAGRAVDSRSRGSVAAPTAFYSGWAIDNALTLRSNYGRLGRFWQLLEEYLDQSPDMWLKSRYAASKKFNWRPVAPTFSRNQPFDENVEGFLIVRIRVASLRRKSLSKSGIAIKKAILTETSTSLPTAWERLLADLLCFDANSYQQYSRPANAPL